MPASAKLALAAVLAASILRAFYGPAPPNPRRGLAALIGLAGGSCYVLAVLVAWGQHAAAASALLAVSVEPLCFAVWLPRGRDVRGGGGPGPDRGPPVDWAEFDRERERWGGSPVLR